MQLYLHDHKFIQHYKKLEFNNEKKRKELKRRKEKKRNIIEYWFSDAPYILITAETDFVVWSPKQHWPLRTVP